MTQQFRIYLLIKQKLSKLTVKNYLADVAQFIHWYENTSHTSFSPKKISQEHIKQYLKTKKLSQLSLNRHISSLRRFFQYLQEEGMVKHNIITSLYAKPQKKDFAEMDEFAYYLKVYNASNLTIKYYCIDVRQFLKWITKMGTSYKGSAIHFYLLNYISDNVIASYEDYLVKQQVYSFSSINRKCAAVRRYFMWLEQAKKLEYQT